MQNIDESLQDTVAWEDLFDWLAQSGRSPHDIRTAVECHNELLKQLKKAIALLYGLDQSVLLPLKQAVIDAER